MPELETRIAQWRTRMAAALPERDEAVAELEEHLREHFAELKRQGKSDDDAFSQAQERLGQPAAIAREFGRMPSGWRPGLVSLPVLALALATLMGALLWNWSRHPNLSAFQVVYLVNLGIYIAGYFGVLGAGLIAACAGLRSLSRPLSERERQAVRRQLKRLARLAVWMIPIGGALGAYWRAEFVPNQWTQWSFHLRLIASTVSVVLLFLVQSRSAASDRSRWLAAILATLAIVLSGFGSRLRIADFPVAWLGALFLAGQAFSMLPRFRIVRVR